MDDRAFWDLVYAGVISIRFHPRNYEFIDPLEIEAECLLASKVADEALSRRREIWDGLQSEPPQ